MNFAAWLLGLSVISGAIVLVDILFFAKKRQPQQKPNRLIEYARSFFPIFLVVLLLRSFLIEPFRIPSGSLEPTLQVGDFLAVNKFIYGIRLPVWEKKIISVKAPKRGDIIVFRWPPNPTYDYIKRVIGIPGDTVAYHHKVLFINGVEAKQSFDKYTIDESSGSPVAEYQENLLGVKHAIYRRSNIPGQDFEITVPPKHYFVMGDNRDDSADSRYWGLVGDEYIRGKAFVIWMSWDGKTYRIRWNRLGKLVN